MSSNPTLQQAQQHLTTAKTLHEQQRYEQAIPLLEEVVQTLEGKEDWEGFMEAACELAYVYRIEFEFDKMDELLAHTFRLYESKHLDFPSLKARFAIEKAQALNLELRHKEAVEYLDQAEKLIEMVGETRNLYIQLLFFQSFSYAKINQLTKAQILLERARELLEKEKNTPQILWADFYRYQTNLEFDKGDYKSAQQSTRKSYQLYTSKSFIQKMSAYSWIGLTFGILGNRKKEWAYYEKILNQLPQNSQTKQIKFFLIGLYRRMAICIHYLGDSQKSIYYHENICDLVPQISKRLDILMVPSYVGLAGNYGMMGNNSKQMDYYTKATKILLARGEERNMYLGAIYADYSSYYIENHQIDKAVSYAQKALEIFIENVGEKHDYTAKVYNQLGMALTFSKHYSEGLKYYYKSLEIFKEKYGEIHTFTAKAYSNIASNLHWQGKLTEALKNYQLALATFSTGEKGTDFYHLPSVEQCSVEMAIFFFELLGEKAETLRDYSQELSQNKSQETTKALRAGLATCQLAADYLQKIQKTIQTKDAKLTTLNSLPAISQLAIEISLSLYNDLMDDAFLARAFTFVELEKSFVLRTSMQENEARLQAMIEATLLERERELSSDIEIYLKEIQREEAKLAPKNKEATERDETRLNQWKQKHFDALQSHQKLIEQFEREYPNYYQLKYNFQTVSVAELQAGLEENTAIISYFIGDELSYVFGVTNEEYEVITLELPSNFDQQIQAYLDAIHAHNYTTFNELSHQLYYHLVRPIDYLIFDPFEEKAKNLVIIPSASLHYLPFETLTRNKSQNSHPDFRQLDYLIRDCQIQYHYSATLFHQNIQATKAKIKTDSLQSPSPTGRDKLSNPSNTPDFVGFAPVYNSGKKATQAALRELAADYSQWASRSEAIRNGQLVPLPFSEQEVQNIQNLFAEKGLEGKSLLYEAASKEQFKSLASNAKYLHIAAHGLTNDQYPKLSGIVFYPTETTTDIQDSVLSMGEMYQLQLQADLVVLSSCESGVGQLAKGEGMIAMNRSFLYAGAKNVVFTLFKVLDKPSSDLCCALFEGILEGKTYSEALRKAKLKLIEQEGVDPKSWCGFVLLGA